LFSLGRYVLYSTQNYLINECCILGDPSAYNNKLLNPMLGCAAVAQLRLSHSRHIDIVVCKKLDNASMSVIQQWKGLVDV
jgi:hypothetical protein